jgi:hypothetical protein
MIEPLPSTIRSLFATRAAYAAIIASDHEPTQAHAEAGYAVVAAKINEVIDRLNELLPPEPRRSPAGQGVSSNQE